MAAQVKGFGRRPFLDGRAGAGAGVRKPPKEETAGRKGAVWAGAIYGDLRVAVGSMWGAGRPEAAAFVALPECDGLAWREVATRLARMLRSEQLGGRGTRESRVRRRAAGGEGERGCGAGDGALAITRCRF